ncbi:unnamed protein product [Symbiodinium natans]|uniref:Uncharacterized protein n=1 Tax=Symbiodinium natans TaxID=878477 RepID=A0A812VGL0_9DINO|nr:unnamed protein product [Symbiodinium natans]
MANRTNTYNHYGGRRRRGENSGYAPWENGNWQWRRDDWRRTPKPSTAAANFDMNRAQDLVHKYRTAGEELYNHAVHARTPNHPETCMEDVVPEMPSPVTWTNMVNAGMPSYSYQQPMMHDGFGWAEWPGFINVPQAAPVPAVMSMNYECKVQHIIDSIVQLQGMGPQQVAQLLKDTAAAQGQYED